MGRQGRRVDLDGVREVKMIKKNTSDEVPMELTKIINVRTLKKNPGF